jgi:DNA processing protein
VICIRRRDPSFPSQLEEAKPPVQQFYAIGDTGLFNTKMVSIVGTRGATSYGISTTRRIATALAEAGVTIVSGLARGVDAAAHEAALACGGKTIAVLGTGADVPYPVGHRDLHKRISQRGLIISEAEPGSRAGPGCFPRRNRIIAALGIYTLVVEADFKSGANNTAAHAREMQRTVAAVPGRIDSDKSNGTNHLLRDGAMVIATVADALVLAGVSATGQRPPATLEGNDALVWSALGPQTLAIDGLSQLTGLPARDCLTSVTSLELSGIVECLVTGEVRRR